MERRCSFINMFENIPFRMWNLWVRYVRNKFQYFWLCFIFGVWICYRYMVFITRMIILSDRIIPKNEKWKNIVVYISVFKWNEEWNSLFESRVQQTIIAKNLSVVFVITKLVDTKYNIRLGKIFWDLIFWKIIFRFSDFENFCCWYFENLF